MTAFLALTLLAAEQAHAQDVAPGSCRLIAGPRRAVIKIIDAATLQLDDGSLLRLDGALPPHPPAGLGIGKDRAGGHGNLQQAWPLLRRTRQALEKLLPGRSIKLAYGSQRKDRYGRRLAQVFILPEAALADAPLADIQPANIRPADPAGDGAAATPQGDKPIWLQGYLVSRGLARAYALPGQDNCLAALIKHESKAIAAGRGLWRNAAYQIRHAQASGELRRFSGSYQLVEGRVLRVGRSRSRYYLNFGRNWRNDFTVAIDKKYVRRFARNGIRIAQLAGQYIRVRGWIRLHNGPLIDVYNSGQIELLREPAE